MRICPFRRAPVQDAPRVLLVRPRKIGDVVLTTPLLRTLRKAWPQARIDYLCGATETGILQLHPAVDAVLAYPRSAVDWPHLLRTLRRNAYDLVLDPYGTPTTARLAWAIGAPRRVGYRLRGRTAFYTHTVPRRRNGDYVVQVFGDLLAPLGLQLDGLFPELFVAQDQRRRARRMLTGMGVRPGELLVAVAPCSPQPFKQWPAERWAALLDDLVGRHGAKPLFLFGPGERPQAERIWNAMNHATLPPVPFSEDLPQLAALLEQARLFVGADTGTRHMAIALGVPSLGLFGPGHPTAWTPPDSDIHRSLSVDLTCKTACLHERCGHFSCIRGIGLQAAQDALEDLLHTIHHTEATGA